MTDNPLHIAQIGSRGIPGHRGGVEQVVEATAPRLAAMGHDVVVYCATWSEYKKSDWKGVRLIYCWSPKNKYFDTIVRSVLATLRELVGGAKIIHFHSSGSAPLSLLARFFGKKVVVTIHGLDWQRRKWNFIGEWFLRLSEYAAVKWPHRTVVVGPALKAMVDKRYGTDVIYIPNGVERRRHREPENIATKWGLSRQEYILFLARIVPEKQCHVLIDAYRQLPDRNGMKLVIAGPTWYSNEYVADLHRRANADPDIIFTGEVTDEELEELYSNCYSYVLPSEVEGMSLSLLDAMAFGSCIIASDIPANTDAIKNAGITFKVGNTSSLRDALATVISDGPLAEDFRRRAAERAATDFDWDNIAARFEELYRKL